MEQELQYLKKHFLDLSRRAENRNIVTFSNFLDMNELNIFYQISKELYTAFQVFGGYELAERQMVAFIPDALSYSWEYPIHAIRINPAHPKFAEALSHRDVLGALMNQGIKREMLGDIMITENEVIVLCVDKISDYIMENCTRIRHTLVHCQLVPVTDFSYTPKLVEKEGTAASMRIDAVIADICHLTRSDAQKTIFEGNVFINSRKIAKNDVICQEKDIISVRHFGKYKLENIEGKTRKGKIKYIYNIYS